MAHGNLQMVHSSGLGRFEGLLSRSNVLVVSSLGSDKRLLPDRLIDSVSESLALGFEQSALRQRLD